MCKLPQNINLSKCNTVFCDSLQALEWLYKNGLPKSATIKTSAPAVLWRKNNNIQDIEKRWSIDDLARFTKSTKELSEDVFDATLSVSGVERELALVIAQTSIMFQQIIYKSACLEEDDFTSSRIFVHINGKGGVNGNNMNSPWDKLLASNPLFSTIDYTLHNDHWDVLSVKEISYWKRYKLAGFETIIYRSAIRFMKYFPDWLFKGKVLIPNENELIIEASANLALRGVKIKEIKPVYVFDKKIVNIDYADVWKSLFPIMKDRIQLWVTPSAVDITVSLFKDYFYERLKKFDQQLCGWSQVIANSGKTKQVVLMNAPGNINGQALSYICRKNSVPFIAAQHGVTAEISESAKMERVGLEGSVADAVLLYNYASALVDSRSYFSKGKQHVVGISSRHTRTTDTKVIDKIPIAYISTNLYRGNLGLHISEKTDYARAIDEYKIVTKVLSKLPYEVLYKSYPEENRRYADIDPVLSYVKLAKNINLYPYKVDMRYLLSSCRILITTKATSTLSWPVMTGKPVVFINWKHNSPLTDEAYSSISKGLFVFNEGDSNFHTNLRQFLSQPLEDIERLWQEKKIFREKMEREYFSAYKNNAGKRSANVIFRDYIA